MTFALTMIEMLIVYAMSVYALFHVAARSDLLAKPRAWLLRTLPAKLTYPLSCCFCFTTWTGVVITLTMLLYTGTLLLSPILLLAAPVVNLLLDLTVKALTNAANPIHTVLSPSVWTKPASSGNGGPTWWYTTTNTTVAAPASDPVCIYLGGSAERFLVGWRIKVAREGHGYDPISGGKVDGRTGTVVGVRQVTAQWVCEVAADDGGTSPFCVSAYYCEALAAPPSSPTPPPTP